MKVPVTQRYKKGIPDMLSICRENQHDGEEFYFKAVTKES